jgi:hypothetical protein
VALVKDARTPTIPFDLGPINVLTYDESLATWTLDEEIRKLSEHVRNVPTGDSNGNAMWQYFGLTKRGDPAEAGSLEAKVDLLLAEVTKLRLEPKALSPEASLAGKDLINTQLVRSNWPDILGSVKKRSEVSWVRLSAATVESVRENTLILRFDQDGEVRDFASAGHSSDLAAAIDELLDIKPRIIATSGTLRYEYESDNNILQIGRMSRKVENWI